MRKIRIILYVLLFMVMCLRAFAYGPSSINPQVPATNAPLTSSVVRNNFLAAYNDVNNIYSIINTVTSGSVYSVFGRSGTVVAQTGDYNFSQLSGQASLTSQVTGVLAASNGGLGTSSIPASGNLAVGNTGGTAYASVAMSGDCTIAYTGAVTCTKTNGTLFGTGATATIANYLAKAGGTMTGELTTETSGTANAPINIPPGSAPTSPVNGDLWTTSSGVYARVAGSTVGPFSAGSGSGTVNAATQYQIPYYSSSGSASVLSGRSQLATDSNYDLFVAGGLAIGTSSLYTGTGVALGYKTVTMGPTVYPANYVSGCTACAYLVMDENAATNDVQLVLRDEGNARATIGMVGDDNIHFQTVSGTYLSESFSDRLVIQGTGSAAPGNIGIGTSAPASLLSVGTNSDCQFDYVGNLTCDGTLNAINTGGNAVVTASGEKTSGNGAGYRLRNPTDGTVGYLAADSYLNGGTSYHKVDIQAAQSDGTVCISGGGLSACGISVSATNVITLASPVINAVSVTKPLFDNIITVKISASATWTPDAGTQFAQIECWGAGGGGGGVAGQTSGANIQTSGGGGSGSYSRKISTAAAIGASQTVTIGTAGTAGSAGNNAGGNGGATSVGSLCIANGGTGGGGAGSSNAGTAGLGGTAGTGDITATGSPGGAGMATTTGSGMGGNGGSTLVGGGGLPPISTGVGVVSGNAGTGFGSGGSGATTVNTSSTVAGGAGTGGYVVITEFISN